MALDDFSEGRAMAAGRKWMSDVLHGFEGAGGRRRRRTIGASKRVDAMQLTRNGLWGRGEENDNR